MSADVTNDPTRPSEAPAAAGGAGAAEPTEEELREQMEEEVRSLRIQDVLLQSVVSIINLAARRIGKEDERDLEQARIGIEATRAVLDLLDPEPGQQVRSALDEIQVMYAKAAGDPAPADASASAQPSAPPAPPTPGGEPAPPPGAPGGLWTPPGA